MNWAMYLSDNGIGVMRLRVRRRSAKKHCCCCHGDAVRADLADVSIPKQQHQQRRQDVEEYLIFHPDCFELFMSQSLESNRRSSEVIQDGGGHANLSCECDRRNPVGQVPGDGVHLLSVLLSLWTRLEVSEISLTYTAIRYPC